MPNRDFNGWDPLSSLQRSTVVDKMVKKNIRNILSSYTIQYDLISELIQNALDALEAKWEVGSYSPKLKIFIDLNSETILVSENGIGLNAEEFECFLAPDVSFKPSHGKTRGHKGVGATYIGYGYNKVWIESKNNELEVKGKHLIVQFFDARKWVDSEDSTPRPEFTTLTSQLDNFLEEENSGTTVKVCIDDQKRPNLDYLGATTAAQWVHILRAQTPLGYLKLSGNDEFDDFRNALNVQVIVKDKDDNVTEVEGRDKLQYLFPHEVEGRIKDLDELLVARESTLDQGLELSRVSSEFKNCDGIWNIWSKDEILNNDDENHLRLFRSTENSDKDLIEKHNIHAYAFYVSSTDVWKDISEYHVGIRRDSKIVWGGLHIATDRMIQGQKLDIPLTKNIGLQQQVHIVIHLDNGNPDMGRKTFQPEITNLCKKIATQIVTRMRWFRYPFIQISDTSGIASRVALENFKTDMILHKRSNPLITPYEDIKSLSIPLWEQDVVALFNQLIALNLLKGYEVYATVSHERYDGLLNINYYNEQELKYNGQNNYLGIKWSGLQESASMSAVIEFKHDFDKLIEDFNNDVKDPSEIDLVVAWDCKRLAHQTEYELRSLFIDQSLETTRRHFGATHTIFNGTQRLSDVILIKDLIHYWNNQDSMDLVYEHQRRYMSSI